MKLGIAIALGPLKLWLGTPRCRISFGGIGRGRPSRRKPPAKNVEASNEVPSTTAKARDSRVDPRIRVTSSFGLDPQVKADSIAALVTLGFPKRLAQARVDAVTAGSSTEDIIKAALRGGR